MYTLKTKNLVDCFFLCEQMCIMMKAFLYLTLFLTFVLFVFVPNVFAQYLTNSGGDTTSFPGWIILDDIQKSYFEQFVGKNSNQIISPFFSNRNLRGKATIAYAGSVSFNNLKRKGFELFESQRRIVFDVINILLTVPDRDETLRLPIKKNGLEYIVNFDDSYKYPVCKVMDSNTYVRDGQRLNPRCRLIL